MKQRLKKLILLIFLITSQIFFGQEKSINGKVLDSKGKALSGAYIKTKESNKSTLSDSNGNFKISASNNETLIVSYYGYISKETKVTSNNITITLEEDVKAIEGIVVTALGIKRKADEITYSSQSVKNSELNQAKAANPVVGLIGKVSGLQINTIDNGVNPRTSIVLRGFRSITGNNQALIVINGVISTAVAFAELNPEIIENINVMKGASGSALYGAQGSNGVIIVTTKKGTKNSEKFKVALNSSFSFDQLAYLPKVQTRYGQGNAGVHEFIENTNWGPELDGSLKPTGLEQKLYTYEARKNNIKDFFNTGTTLLNSLAVSSGDENGYMNLSIGNQKTDGIIPNDIFKKNNFNLSAGKTAGRLSVNGNMRYTTSTANTVGGIDNGSPIYNTLLQTPINIPVREFNSGDNSKHWAYFVASPYWRLKNERVERKTQTFEGVGELVYNFNENISAVYRASFRSAIANSSGFLNAYKAVVQYLNAPLDINSVYSASSNSARSLYSDLIVNFDYNLSENLTFKANIGNNITNFETNSISVQGSNLIIPNLYNISNITGEASASDEKSKQRGYSYFINTDFGFKDYLFLNLTGRKEWTSVLSKDNNSFPYGSAGLSFIPTKAFENIQSNVLNYLKLSASIVKVGNSVISPYQINNGVNVATDLGFPYLNVNSFILNPSITDSNIKNESTISKELNLNVEMLNRRITFDASYFTSKNFDQIVSITPSFASGASNATINIGETRTTGLELDLGLTPIKSKNLTWDLRLSYSNPKTTVKKVSDKSREVPVEQYTNTLSTKAIEGELFPLIVGTGYLRDNNGNVIIDASNGDPLKQQNKILGQTTPEYILGLNTNIKYKNVRLSGVFDYRTGHVFYAGTKADLVRYGSDIVTAQNGREPFIFPNSVIETAPGVFSPNTTIPTSGNQQYFSGTYSEIDENFVLDATAFKCRELALSYEFSKKSLKNLSLSSLSIGLNVRNAFMVLPKENRNYSDPEFSTSTGNGVGVNSSATAPPTRTYGFNVNITF